MKNLFIVLLSVLSLTGSAQNSDESFLQEFIASPDYAAFVSGSPFGQLGTPDIKQSFVGTVLAHNDEIQKEVPLLNLQLVGLVNGKKRGVGQIMAIKVKEGYTGLPRNGKYLMLYKDLRQFNTENSTGTIKVYDLNYDSYQAGEALLSNGAVSQYIPVPLPDQVAAKYNLTSRSSLPCTNLTGNTTFGECFSCMMGSCVLNPNCNALCLVAGSIEWQCTRSIQFYCSMIALVS